MKIEGKPIKNLRVTIMGLGLHGGGVASALFFASRGACVTVTDLNDEKRLTTSLEKLKFYPVRYVLGEHREEDFVNTDLVIKNPGVPSNSQFLKLARKHNIPVETDISIFLKFCHNPLIAVTGSKGKSTTASAIYFCLKKKYGNACLGGNITVSPLTFLTELDVSSPVVLELSSWQLADLRDCPQFKPFISIITNILPDHMNHYKNMSEYIADKKIIYKQQGKKDFSIFNRDQTYTQEFLKESGATSLLFSQNTLAKGINGAFLKGDIGYIRYNNKEIKILYPNTLLTGLHNRLNMLCAALALFLFGLDYKTIRSSLAKFQGIEHRMEFFHELRGIKFYNDSAATIPQATLEAIKSLKEPILLIIGGTDKNLDFKPLEPVLYLPKAIFLLQGSATVKIIECLNKQKLPFYGPFSSLEQVTKQAYEMAKKGQSILFSPGCASFELFLNEFDRGKKFKKLVFSLNSC